MGKRVRLPNKTVILKPKGLKVLRFFGLRPQNDEVSLGALNRDGSIFLQKIEPSLISLISFLKDIKFEHSLFALPFAYLGLFLAEGGLPRFPVFIWVTVAMASFRTFAMAMNRLIDSEIDAKNPRTQLRALPQSAPGSWGRFVSFCHPSRFSWR
jgi:hypothetical protein